MEQKAQFKGKYVHNKGTYVMDLPIIIFKDGNNEIVYCPALDLSGYGKNEDDAKESFKVCLGEFFKYTTNKNTLRKELCRLGWVIKNSKNKPMLPPSMSQLLEENDNFSNIFNNYPFRKIDEQIEIPALSA